MAQDEKKQGEGARLLRGALAGLVAGAVASFAMDRFQALVSAASSDEGGGDSEPATARAADSVARVATGSEVAEADKPLAGQLVHYGVGAALGIAYGVAAAYRPAVTAGYGAAFAIGTAAVLDEGAVPAAGWGEAPWQSPASTHLYSLASHLVFGVVAEAVRRQVDATLRPA